MKCEKCDSEARYRFSLSGDGGTLSWNRYACDQHAELVKDSMAAEPVMIEKRLGNHHYPRISLMKWGMVRVFVL